MSHLLLQDLGTVSLLLFIAATILIRARYFCRYGREALGVVIAYLLATAIERILFVHLNIGPPQSREISGVVAGSFGLIQVSNVWMAEQVLRQSKAATE